jgi:hypothetical protein
MGQQSLNDSSNSSYIMDPKGLLSCSKGSPMDPTLSHTYPSTFTLLAHPSLSHISGHFPSDFQMKIPYSFLISPIVVHAPSFQYPWCDHTTNTVKSAYNETARDLIFSVAGRFRFIQVLEVWIPRTA